MFEFVIGVVVGAAFSPFWISMWNALKPKVMALFPSKDQEGK